MTTTSAAATNMATKEKEKEKKEEELEEQDLEDLEEAEVTVARPTWRRWWRSSRRPRAGPPRRRARGPSRTPSASMRRGDNHCLSH